MALPLILKTFGALPKRQAEQDDYAERRKISFPKTPDGKVFTFDSKIPNAAAMVVWKVPATGKDVKTA
ncbi:MAG: hypothetical protein AAGF75_09110, partial [Cyanobacteria bacterium P01_H01_bin.130]